jgi:phosphonate degradation associated HDIG domain protein
MTATIVERIEALFVVHGRNAYEGARRELVTALEHALQCAQLAEWAHAKPSLVAAALLHDVGHFIESTDDENIDDEHETRALRLLAPAFGADVIEPVRLHVQAKRFLVAVDPDYAATLSPASVHSLALQGGPMSQEEVCSFEELPFYREALMLRRWDDLAKQPGKGTPPLAYYLALLEELSESYALEGRIGIGAGNIA